MRLVHRITLAILSALMVVVAIVGLSLYVSVERGFTRYIRAVEESRLQPAARRIAEVYARTGSWEALARDPRWFGNLLRSDGPRPPQPPRRPRDPGPADCRPAPRPPRAPDTDPLDVPRRVSLFDQAGRRVVGEGRLEDTASQIPLVVDGATVGWLGIHGVKHVDEDLDAQYLHQIRAHLLGIVLAAVAAGLLTGWLLTRWILRPIAALSAGTRRLAAGDHDVRIGPGNDDELGQVMRDFNTLAATLGEDARARRQWVADTSHELRTPITVLRAEIEAIIDGVRPMSAASIASLHAEILRLGKLVEDLEALARSDRGALSLARAPLAPDPIVAASVEAFRGRFQERGIAIDLRLAAGGARVAADPARLRQVLANLFENSVRYTDEGGRVEITSAIEDGAWCLRCDDSPPGVPPEAIGRLFERLYRVDASRARAHGGSGLGLAICQRLVEAHDGTITASPSPLGGVRIEVRLPLIEPQGIAT